MATQTEEVKLIITAEEKASREVARLMKNLRGFQGQMNKTFSTKIDSGILNSKGVTEGFKKYGDGLSQINERHTRWANNMRRLGRMTHQSWQEMNKELDKYIKSNGEVRKLSKKQAADFVELTRRLRAYEQVWGRQHERYISSLGREQKLKDQVERAKDRLSNLGFQNEKRRRATIDALDRQRSRAYLASERAKSSAAAALSRQRSRAYLAQIREEERAGRKAEANKLREQLRTERMQESARRSLDAQRSRAFLGEERRRQQLRINSWRMQMRQEEAARREQEQVRSQRIDRGKAGVGQAVSGVQSGAGTIALMSGIAAAAAVKVAQMGLGARSRAENAEANLMMFGDLSRSQVEQNRRGWINSAAIENGFRPAAAINAFTESLKAGIPQEMAPAVTKSIMGASAGLDLNVADTTKLVGRLATLTQDPKRFNPAAIDEMLNGIAVVAKVTAADSNELVSSLRRGAGVLGSSKMSVSDLTAFTGIGISTGMQEGKAGTFMDFLVNELVNSKNARGLRREDLAKGARLAGLGSLNQVSAQAANNPTELLLKLFEKMASMDPQKAGQVASLIGMREWRGEMLQMMKGTPMLRQTVQAEREEARKKAADPNYKTHVERAQEIRLGTISGVGRQLAAVSDLLLEGIGKGLEEPFRELSRFMINFGKGLDLDVIQAHVKTLVDGFIDGLGFNSVSQVLEALFGKPGEFNFGTVDAFFRFAQGFGRGIRQVIDLIHSIIPANGFNAEDIGRYTALLTGFSTAITAAKPAFDVLGALKDILVGLAAALIGMKAALGISAMAGGAGAAGAAGAGGLAAILGSAVLPVSLVAISAGVVAALFGKEAIKGLFLGVPSGNGGVPRTPEGDLGSELGGAIRPRVQKQSFNGVESLKDLIQKASFNGYDDRNDGIERLKDSIGTMGVRFQLAALGNIGGTTSMGSGGSGGGGFSGTGGGGSASSFGKNFFTPDGMKVPGWYGGDASGGPAKFGMAGKTFSSKAPGIMKNLMADFGLTKEQAAGIVGNLGHESAGFTAYQEKNPRGGGRGGAGWAQWTGPRRRQFEAWAAAKGLDPRSDEASYGFLKHELNTTERKSLAAVRRQSTTQGAMVAFENSFERAGVKAWGSRMRYAQQAYGANLENVPTAGVPSIAGSVPSLTGTFGSTNGLRIKSGEALAGGVTNPAIIAAAQMIQNGNVAGGLNRFTAFNDLYHKGTRSKHASGLAGDFTLKDASQSGAAAEQVRRMFRAAGLTDDQFKVIDEYKNPSSRSTGGHIHYQLNSALAAAKYAQAVQARASAAVANTQKTVDAANAANGTRLNVGDGMTSTGWQKGSGSLNDSAVNGVPARRVEDAMGRVPLPPKRPVGLGGGAGGGGSQGPTIIHVNGAGENPEAVAQKVENRLSDRWNHRAHDLEPELV